MCHLGRVSNGSNIRCPGRVPLVYNGNGVGPESDAGY